MLSLHVLESNVIHLPNMNSAQWIQWLSNKNELTTTRFPSTTFLFIIVSFPSHFCTWFSTPLSRVMTFCQRKKKQSVAVSSGCCGLKGRLSPCPNSTEAQSTHSALTFEGNISTLDVKITTLSLLRGIFGKCRFWTHLCFSVICCGLIKLFTQLERDLCIFEGTFCFDGYHITTDADSYIGLGHTSHFPGSKPHTCK